MAQSPSVRRRAWPSLDAVPSPPHNAGAMSDAPPRSSVPPDIVIVDRRIDPRELARLTGRFFGDMVKLVVDIDRGIAAVGGELHADAEALLLDAGSRPEHIWGANYFPGRGRERCLEFTALINIRPSLGNRSMEVQDERVRERIRNIAVSLLGEGEPLP